MSAANKVVDFNAFKQAKGFSDAVESGQKMSSQTDHSENGKGPEYKGLHAVYGITHPGSSEVNGTCETSATEKTQKAAKTKNAKKPSKVAPLTDIPSAAGYVHDAEHMSATALRLNYPLTYSSWRNRKNASKANGWPWSGLWNDFPDFLKSMGPRSSKAYSLHCLDPHHHAYGPDLCKWADVVEQNNTKTTTLAIVDPLTGKKWTSHALAKKHKVKLKTIHNWKASFWSDLEMIVGKKDSTLAAVSLALPALVAPSAQAAMSAKRPHFRLPPAPVFDTDAEATDEDLDRYHETGEMRFSLYEEKLAEHAANVEWIKCWNAGLPCSPEPPQGKHYTLTNPVNRPGYKPAPSKPAPAEDDDDDEYGFDPADDVDPDDYA